MTAQKKILDLTGSQYLVQKVKSAISDVDSSLSTHIADTDIHVTASDKTTWNAVTSKANDSDVVHKTGDETSTGFKQFANIRATNSIKGINLDGTTTDLNNCYSVFAPYNENKGGNIQYYYCNTDSGTANISNLPEAKAFVLTSITTRLISTSLYVKQILINSNSKTFVRYCNNSTWSSWVNETDSEYVHKSGNETVGGVKTFSDNPVIGNNNTNITISNRQITANGSYSAPTGSSYSFMQLKAIVNYADSSPSIDATVGLSIQENAYSDGKKAGFSPNSNNTINLGKAGKRWANVYATNYYYGGTEIEFSDKFVTTDTDQTISGSKTFLDVPITLKSSTAELGVTGGNAKVILTDKNLLNLAGVTFGNYGSSKLSYCRFHIYDKDSNNQEVENFIEFSYVNNNQVAYFRPNKSNFASLGTVSNRWSKVYATNYYYGNDNIEFSTKFVTTDTAQTVGGSKTFSDGIGLNSWLYFTNSLVTKGTIPQSTVNPYRIYFGSGVNYGASLFNIDTSVSNTGVQSFTFRSAENVVSGDDARFALIYDPNRTQPRYLAVKGNIEPNTNNTYDCGLGTNIWKDLYCYHGYFRGQQQNDEYSGNARTNLTLLANRDTLGTSGCLIDSFRENTTQGTGSHIIGFGIKENSVRYEGCRFSWLWDDNLGGYRFAFRPTLQGTNQAVEHDIGLSTDKWDKINGVEPSSLGMPDLSNAVDISSYITDLTGNPNAYSPPANGYIAIRSTTANVLGIVENTTGMGLYSRGTNQVLAVNLPVVKNSSITIYAICSSLSQAKFIPCQGNV